MANMTRTVGAAGDHTTIAAAMSYIVSNFTYTGTDVATIQLIDAAELLITTSVTLGGVPGTESATSYLVIEADADSRHDGTYNTSKSRVRTATSGQHVFIVSDNFVHMRYLSIKQDSAGSSDECIHINTGVTDLVIEKCVLETANVSGQDGIYSGNYACGPITVFDTVVKLGGSSARSCIHPQIYTGVHTQTWHVEHCTLDSAGVTASEGGGVNPYAFEAGAVVNAYVYNTAAFNAVEDAGTGDFMNASGSGAVNWVGQGNMGGDTTCQTNLGTTNNLDSQTMSVTDEAATEFLVTSLTAGNEDYQLIEGASSTNNAVGAAISGGTRDSRLDITVDIAGNPRPATYTDRDIGAFQVLGGGTNTSIIVPTGPLR